jgi:hypothetical protein
LAAARQFKGVLDLIECRQAQLKAEAHVLGRRLFAEKPDALRIVLVNIGELGRRKRNVVEQRKDPSCRPMSAR